VSRSYIWCPCTSQHPPQVLSDCHCGHPGARVRSSARAARLAVLLLGADPDPGRLHGGCRKAEHVRRLRQHLLGGLARSVTGAHFNARNLHPPSVKSESCARSDVKQVGVGALMA
jgi:hypothetical protein